MPIFWIVRPNKVRTPRTKFFVNHIFLSIGRIPNQRACFGARSYIFNHHAGARFLGDGFCNLPQLMACRHVGEFTSGSPSKATVMGFGLMPKKVGFLQIGSANLKERRKQRQKTCIANFHHAWAKVLCGWHISYALTKYCSSHFLIQINLNVDLILSIGLNNPRYHQQWGVRGSWVGVCVSHLIYFVAFRIMLGLLNNSPSHLVSGCAFFHNFSPHHLRNSGISRGCSLSMQTNQISAHLKPLVDLIPSARHLWHDFWNGHLWAWFSRRTIFCGKYMCS